MLPRSGPVRPCRGWEIVLDSLMTATVWSLSIRKGLSNVPLRCPEAFRGRQFETGMDKG
jgi:hypothetical protein